ncbi:MAG: zinc metallopeptidase [Clostridiales bacterium]|jgi:Zn-dependent membrane protease YugP|nr:zinc metallopeptidase [Clostridiales bacterium]
MPFYDWTIILLIPAIILGIYAQARVSGAYKKYSEVTNRRGLTGADIARAILAAENIRDVQVTSIAGQLTDHYDPRTKTLALSSGVINSRSLAAAGIAAHETGHAIQHAHGYAPMGLRSALVPAANFGSRLAMPLILGGFLLSYMAGEFGVTLIYIGIALYAVAVLFTLVTLPVEFNASNRAMRLLATTGVLEPDELVPAKKVLDAAALTYVAAALSAVLTLLRFIIMSRGRD